MLDNESHLNSPETKISVPNVDDADQNQTREDLDQQRRQENVQLASTIFVRGNMTADEKNRLLIAIDEIADLGPSAGVSLDAKKQLAPLSELELPGFLLNTLRTGAIDGQRKNELRAYLESIPVETDDRIIGAKLVATAEAVPPNKPENGKENKPYTNAQVQAALAPLIRSGLITWYGELPNIMGGGYSYKIKHTPGDRIEISDSESGPIADLPKNSYSNFLNDVSIAQRQAAGFIDGQLPENIKDIENARLDLLKDGIIDWHGNVIVTPNAAGVIKARSHLGDYADIKMDMIQSAAQLQKQRSALPEFQRSNEEETAYRRGNPSDIKSPKQSTQRTTIALEKPVGTLSKVFSWLMKH